jgi:hypothetical protein
MRLIGRFIFPGLASAKLVGLFAARARRAPATAENARESR